MVNSGVIIPFDFSHIIDERAILWQKYDEAQNQSTRLNKLVTQELTFSIPPQIHQQLSGENTPPAELAVA